MKKIFVTIFLFIFSLSLHAQQSRDLIGIAIPETYVQRWVKDGNSLKAEAEKRGYRAEVLWANGDQLTQNQQIQSFIRQGAKVIIIGSIDDGIAGVLAEAKRNGIVIIAYDRIIPNSDDVDYYITYNNYKVGELQSQSIINGLNLSFNSFSPPKNITLFAGSPRDGNASLFFDGAMSVLNPYIESGVLNVIGPYPKTSADIGNFRRIATDNWQPSIAKSRMENLLNNDARNLVLDAVLAPNDTIARAIIEAIKADQKYRFRMPIVCGQDAEYDSVLSIRNGEQYSTVFKNTNRLAEAAIILADALIKGHFPNIPDTTLASGDLREVGNNGRKYIPTYLLNPELITRYNLFIPIEAGFYDGRGDVNRLR